MQGNAKNIIILGCQRSGKTTLAKMLASESNYTLFSADSLIYAFDRNIPNNTINSKVAIVDKSYLLTHFIEDYFLSFTRNYKSQKFLIDSCQLLPKDVMNSKLLSRSTIICLGYPDATVDELFLRIREVDKNSNAYTESLSDSELVKSIQSWIKYSKMLQYDCKKLEIPFYSTNIDRDNVLENLAKKIIEYEL